MIGEVDVYGVFVPILLVWGLIALVVTAGLRRVLSMIGFYRLVWHRPLVDLSLLVIVLAAVAAVLPSLAAVAAVLPRLAAVAAVLPRWIAS